MNICKALPVHKKRSLEESKIVIGLNLIALNEGLGFG